MVTPSSFTALVLLVAVQRLWETYKSRTNARALHAKAAVEHARGQMPWMIAVHTLWLVSMLVEVWRFDARAPVALSALALIAFACGQTLRFLAMRALGPRWTVTVVTPTQGEPPVSHGIYAYLRHPNYLGVVLEIAALPLIHGAYVTALVFSAANGVLLYARIRAEERALDANGHYSASLGATPRFVPGLRRPPHGP